MRETASVGSGGSSPPIAELIMMDPLPTSPLTANFTYVYVISNVTLSESECNSRHSLANSDEFMVISEEYCVSGMPSASLSKEIRFRLNSVFLSSFSDSHAI